MLISSGDYENWKADPVTKGFFAACEQRVEDAKDVLSDQAGEDSARDNFMRGLIFAYREIGNFRIENEGETE
tara:strand:- start:268 stop:483 length:216 start_codon:yes stop_codon:yes gene_type:complete